MHNPLVPLSPPAPVSVAASQPRNAVSHVSTCLVSTPHKELSTFIQPVENELQVDGPVSMGCSLFQSIQNLRSLELHW